MRGRFPCPLSLIETLSPIEKSFRGFGSLTRGRSLNRNDNNKKPYGLPRPPSGEFSWLPVGGRERSERARARGLDCRWQEAVLILGDGGGSERGGRFLSFVIAVSPSGHPAGRAAWSLQPQLGFLPAAREAG